MNHFHFNHEADDFFEAIGIDERYYDIANYTTIYCILAPIVTAALLDMDSESRTKSKVLEETLNRIRLNNIPIQETALLLCFDRTYKQTMERIKLYNDVLKDNVDTGAFKGGNVSMGSVTGSNLSEAMQSLAKLMEARPIAQMVEVLKETNCSYEKFIHFTVDEIDLRVITGQMTQEEVEREDEEREKEIDKSIPERVREIFRNATGKKKSSDDSKKYGDIDDIIRKAFENDDDE